MQIPAIFKSYIGKPKYNGDTDDIALAYEPDEKVEEVTLDDIRDHVYYFGQLVYPAAFDIPKFLEDKNSGLPVKTARQYRYFVASGLMVVDIDEGLPAGMPADVIGWLLDKSAMLRKHAGLIFPSSSFTPELPKLHVFLVLDGLITDHEEFSNLFTRLCVQIEGETGVPCDRAMAKVTQPLYGTVYSKWNVEKSSEHGYDNDDAECVSVEWLKSLPAPVETKQHRVRRERVEREGVERHARAVRGGRAVREVKRLVKFILDRLDTKLSNDDWYAFRLAAATACGHSSEVWELIVNSAYWCKYEHEYDWSRKAEERRWYSEEADVLTVGSLYYMAHRLGWGRINRAEITEPTEIDGLDELEGSYLLKAHTGIGKSEAQRPAIKATLEGGKRVLWIVPTKSLARAAARSFADLGAVVYLDAEGEIKSSEELRALPFVVTTPQTFTLRIASRGLSGYGLLVLDEIEQIIDAAVEVDNDLWKKDERIALQFRSAVRYAIEAGMTVRGLDAGLARAAHEWLPMLPTYECTEVRDDKAPVTVYDNRGSMLLALWSALERGGLVYVTCDRKDTSHEIATDIAKRYPDKRILLVNGETVTPRNTHYHGEGVPPRNHYDARAIDFMNDPNEQARLYDVIIVSPTMLTGVSITAHKAEWVFQFIEHLTPKSNLQMLNRFRQQGGVFAYVGGMSAVGDVKTPEEVAERAALLTEGLTTLPRSTEADEREWLRYWVELDKLYQSFDPLAYYIQLLEAEGRKVDLSEEGRKVDHRHRAPGDEEARKWALEHWHEVKEYDPLEKVQDEQHRELLARLLKRDVERKTEGGWKESDDMIYTGTAAQQYTATQLGVVEIATGQRAAESLNMLYALDPERSPSLVKTGDKIVVLLHALHILGYRGETSIPAFAFVEHGTELVQFLGDNKRYWNAIFSRKYDDYGGNVRSLVKDLLKQIGLRMRQGSRVRVGDALQYDADVENVAELKHLLYLRACGRAGERLPKRIELVFPELAREAHIQADADAMDWFMQQTDGVQQDVVSVMHYEHKRFAEAVEVMKHGYSE